MSLATNAIKRLGNVLPATSPFLSIARTQTTHLRYVFCSTRRRLLCGSWSKSFALWRATPTSTSSTLGSWDESSLTQTRSKMFASQSFETRDSSIFRQLWPRTQPLASPIIRTTRDIGLHARCHLPTEFPNNHTTDRCIPLMDHYCIWIHVCVYSCTMKPYLYFIMFLLLAFKECGWGGKSDRHQEWALNGNFGKMASPSLTL